MGSFRLGVDVGGTNTDLVLYDEISGSQLIEKLPSTPSNPALAILEGVSRLIARGVAANDVGFFAHGTTVTTNALLEHRGVRIGLFINKGYTGIVDVQTQTRGGNMFDYSFQRPEPLVSPRDIREISGRFDHRGVEVTPLDIEAVRQGVRELARDGVRSFAVCYVFSFMNPAHEEATAEAIRSIVPDAVISISSEIMPRIREWPRFSTTMLNAYLEPTLISYIDDLAKGLDKLGVPDTQRFLMQSNGGVMPFSAVVAGGNTVHTLLSGPAAGVQGCCHLISGTEQFRNLITMDIGGTSCDVAFIEAGTAIEVDSCLIQGRQVEVPCLDITTIAAGGGTIARVDRGGFLVVGPESAGAVPGPACFGRGGNLPTITDAYIVCGLLSQDSFLGGAQKIDVDAAYRAIEQHLALPMKMSVHEAAGGILRIVNAAIADEIRLQASKKGVELSTFSIVAFGGAGPVQAAAVAEELGINNFIVPFSPGAFSALGLLCSDVVHDFMRSDLSAIGKLSPAQIESQFEALEKEASEVLASESLSVKNCEFIRELDMRYAGQGFELRVGLNGLNQGKSGLVLEELVETFHALHESQHGHAARDGSVEIVSYRLRAKIKTSKIPLQGNAQAPGGVNKVRSSREIQFGSSPKIKTPVLHRLELARDEVRQGPAVVVQFDTTTIIPPGWAARTDKSGNLVVTRSAA